MSEFSALMPTSPIDGRYRNYTKDLQDYFSEYGLIKYRVLVEIEYFKALCEIPLPQLTGFPQNMFSKLDELLDFFGETEAKEIKAIEKK